MSLTKKINEAASAIDPEEEIRQQMARRKELEQKEAELRDQVNDVLEESDIYSRVVNNLISPYISELDSFSDSMDRLVRQIRNGDIVNYTDLQLEMRTIVLAQAIHKAADGLGALGSQSDVARMNREQKFAQIYKAIPSGTIPDKKAEAEEYVLTEKQIEAIFQRAYQTVAGKIKSGNRVLEAVKKVLSSRMIAAEVYRKDLNDQMIGAYSPRENLLTGEELDDTEADDGELG